MCILACITPAPVCLPPASLEPLLLAKTMSCLLFSPSAYRSTHRPALEHVAVQLLLDGSLQCMGARLNTSTGFGARIIAAAEVCAR